LPVYKNNKWKWNFSNKNSQGGFTQYYVTYKNEKTPLNKLKIKYTYESEPPIKISFLKYIQLMTLYDDNDLSVLEDRFDEKPRSKRSPF
jgi:hypothetical protein